MKSLTVPALVWFAALVLLLVFAAPLNDALFFFSPLFHWGIALAGVVLLLRAALRSRHGLRSSLPTLLLTGIGLCLLFTSGYRMGRLAFFQLRKSHYSELLAEAERTGAIPSGTGVLEEGPPPRYAFYWQRGITDNWAGVVHDPSGSLLRVNEMGGIENLHDPEFSDVVDLFGGHLFRCEPLGDGWYLCWFT